MSFTAVSNWFKRSSIKSAILIASKANNLAVFTDLGDAVIDWARPVGDDDEALLIKVLRNSVRANNESTHHFINLTLRHLTPEQQEQALDFLIKELTKDYCQLDSTRKQEILKQFPHQDRVYVKLRTLRDEALLTLDRDTPKLQQLRIRLDPLRFDPPPLHLKQ